MVERPIDQEFRGESFAIHGRVFTCADCGFETMVPAERDALVHATWAAYRERNGLILYGIIREMVSNLTARSANGPLLLPTLDFRKVLTRKEAPAS